MLRKIMKYGLEYALKRLLSRSGHIAYKKPYYKKRKKFKLKNFFD